MSRLKAALFGILLLVSLNIPEAQAQDPPWSLQILAADPHSLLVELILSGHEITSIAHDGLQYQRLNVPGWEARLGKGPGWPELPLHAVLLGMPHPGQPQVTIVESESEIVNRVLIYPTPALLQTGTVEAPQIVETFTFNAEAYRTAAFYPGSLAEAAAGGLLRDQPVVQLRFYPFQYQPQQRRLQIYHRLKVLVTFPEGDVLNNAAVPPPPVPLFEEIFKRTLLNYSSFSQPASAPTASPSRPTPNLQALTAGATYLIITHPNFYNSLQTLANYRNSQGETVAIVKTTDLYNRYGNGSKDPHAIRAFLVDAYANWLLKPVYVLLVGDASSDLDPDKDLFPAYYVDTPLFGMAPNDAWYAKIHGNDDYPDVIVGRLPVRTIAEVQSVINKVITYEQSPRGDGLQRAVLVADDNISTFAQDMDTVAALLPTPITSIKLYRYQPNTNVTNEVNNGALLLAYSGHGNTDVWGSWLNSRIFSKSQMQNLANGVQLPFMTVANCLNGYFSSPTSARSMAEEFLLLDNRGGIASWAPASYGFPSVNSLVMEEMYKALFVDNEHILGVAATTARLKSHIRRPDFPLALVEVFTYLGDPAVMITTGNPTPNDPARWLFLPVIVKNY